MYQEMYEQRVMSIGFARSLIWAAAVTGTAIFIAADVTQAHGPILLPVCLLSGAIFYPFAANDRPRYAARSALLAALLLVPILESAHRPWLCLLSAAVVIGLLRSWSCWAKSLGFYLWRELTCIAASVALGAHFFDDTALGLAFSVWGFCLGQVAAALFDGAVDRLDCVD